MTYFELFEIPVQLRVDKEALRRRFFELSRRYHPDYFAQAGADAQGEALELSALLNKAYKTLSDEDALIGYLLGEKGLMEADERYALPAGFLMEMMELNEELQDAEGDAGAREKVENELANWQKTIYEPVAKIVADYQEGVTSEEELLQVKAYYYKKKYLRRLAGQLGQKP